MLFQRCLGLRGDRPVVRDGPGHGAGAGVREAQGERLEAEEDDRLRQLGGGGVRAARLVRVGDRQAEQDYGEDGGRRQHRLLLDGANRKASG